MKLIVLAAGKGTRFLPITKDIPKGLIPINRKPLLEHVLKPYLPHVSDIIFVINDELGYKLKEHFGTNFKNHNVYYVIQDKNTPKGTMSALTLAKEHVLQEKLFCVSNCDDLLKEEEIVDAFKKQEPGIGITFSKMPWNYLSIDTNVHGIVTGFRRHTQEEGLVLEDYFSNGFHILSNKVFEFEKIKTRDGEFGLPQTLFENLKELTLKGFIFKKWQAVNGPSDLPNAEDFINQK
ncbi:MAG: nucleotidyltransferase family protein [Minisyncoccia bacterium]